MDNWKHRSENMKCKTCMFFIGKGGKSEEGFKIGRCRESSPTLKGWPAVFPDDWCGAHKLDETKLTPVGRVVLPKWKITEKGCC